MAKTVVILGSSLGGLAVAHRLLKYTLPKEEHLKVILVSRNSHFYWNPASVRAVIPGIVKDDELLQPIAPGLAKYPPGSVEFVLGTADSLDTTSKTVQVSASTSSSSSSSPKTISYDYLVLATGADAADPRLPWKASGTYEECLASLHATAARIRAASHIVIAGAGPTGVELAAEIRYECKDKQVVLLCAGDALLGGDSTAPSAERELSRLGVVVRKGVRAVDVAKQQQQQQQQQQQSDNDDDDGKTSLGLSNGETITTDLYLSTTGLVPNSGYLPAELLTASKYVDVDEYMQVRAAKDVWAVGDIVSKPRAGFLITEAQAEGVAKNIELVLQGKDQQVVKGPYVDAFLCSMGRSRGVGRLGSVHVPSLLVWAVKSRTLGMERTKKYVDGTMW